MPPESAPSAEEEALVRSFVVAAKQRAGSTPGSPEAAREGDGDVAHCRDLDRLGRRAFRAIDRTSTRSSGPAVPGAGDTCHVISESPAIDGSRLPLPEALGVVVGFGLGTLLSCVPGKLAYFEGEGPSDRCILARPSA
jgi:hypothetical protein